MLPDVPAGVEVRKRLRQELLPVSKRSGHAAYVDVVELIMEGPFVFGVVYLEFKIRRDPEHA